MTTVATTVLSVSKRHMVILWQWFEEIHAEGMLPRAVMGMGLVLVDRFLRSGQGHLVNDQTLQLVSCACLGIANKWLEDEFKEIDFADLCASAYDERDFLTMERHVLTALSFDLQGDRVDADFQALMLEFGQVDVPNTTTTHTHQPMPSLKRKRDDDGDEEKTENKENNTVDR